MNYSVIILAAGSGKRADLGYNKLFYTIDETPLIALTASHFYNDQTCSEIIFVCHKDEINAVEEMIKAHHYFDERSKFVVGGSERQYSVGNGLNYVTNDIVLIHDGARPFITSTLIDSAKHTAYQYGCALPGVKVTDSIKMVNASGIVEQSLNRDVLYHVQTPQACQTKLIKKAHELTIQDKLLTTDDASLIEYYKLSNVKLIDGLYDNIKVTTQKDLLIAEGLYSKYFKGV